MTNTSSTSAILSLTANTTYYWWVRSNCGAEQGSWVSGGSFTTACTPPNTPSNVVTSNVTASTLTVSFTAASPAPSGYMVFLSTTTTVIPTLTHGTTYVEGTDYTIGGHIYKCVISNGNTTAYDLVNGIPNTQHNYFVFSRSNNICFGAPWYSTGVSGFAITCAVAPTNLSVSSITTTGATFNWTNPTSGNAGVTTSKLNIYSSNAYTPAVLVTTVDNVSSGHILTTLSPSTTYWYQIVNDNGTCSSLANGGSFATACDATPIEYSQGFNSATIPACWSVTNVAVQSSSYITFVTSSANPNPGLQEGTRFVKYDSYTAPAGSEERLNSLSLSSVGIGSVDLEFYMYNDSGFSAKTAEGIQIQYLLDGINWTDVSGAFFQRYAATNSWNLKKVTLPAACANASKFYVGFKFHSEFGNNIYLDNVVVKQSPPTLLVNSTSLEALAFGNHAIGSTVPTQSFSLSGANLTGFPSNITVTSPSSAFQVSSDGGATWGATTIVAYSSATLAAQNILVKYIPTACGAASTGDLTFSGGGVTVYPTVSLSGTATLAQPIATVATAITPNSFTANWNAVSGATGYELDVYEMVDGGLINKFTENFNGFTAGQPNAGANAMNISATVNNYTQTLGWSGTQIYQAGGTAKLGSGSSLGTITTPEIDLSADTGMFSLELQAMAWNGDSPNLKIYLNNILVHTINDLNNTPAYTLKSYVIPLSGGTSTSSIRFEGNANASSRFFLENLVIKQNGKILNYVLQNHNVGNLTSYNVPGLSPGKEYYYVVRATVSACKSANSNIITVNTLHDTTTYNGSVPNDWDHGVPVASVNAVINGNYTATGDLSSKTLTINADNTLTLNANTSFTTGDFINNGKLIVESDANFVQNMGSNNSGTGDATVKRIANIKRQDYVYWSSPVANQNLKAFSPGTLNVRFLSYDELTNAFVPVFTATDSSTATTVFGLGAGYAIRASNSQPNTVQDWLGQFVGTPNNGNVDVDITKNGEGNNLIGNPYPSNINLSGSNGLFTLNSGKTTDTAYFWTNVNPNVPATQNYNQANYAVYTQSGSNPAQNSTVEPTGVVKVGQAFIVQALSTGTLNIRNEMREASAASIFFDKNASDTKDRFWLRLTTPANDFNTTLIAYIQNATNGFEYGFDANVFGQSSDAVYTKLDSQKFAIQGRQFPLNTKDVVSVGSSHFASGQYKFSISKAEGIFANGQHVYLKDKHTNTITDLSAGDYVFNAVAGNTEDRFEIVYENDLVLGNDNQVRKNLIIYRNGDEFIIKSNDDKITEVELYDSVGRLLITVKPNATEARINVSHLSNAFYVLKIDQNGKVSSKKVIK